MPRTTLDDGWPVSHVAVGTGTTSALVLVLGSAAAVEAAVALAAEAGEERRLLILGVQDLVADSSDTALASERLLAFLEATQTRDATLVGHIAGCAVVVRAAGRAPEGMVARLALISSPVRIPAPDGAVAALDYAADLADVPVATLVLHSETDLVSPLHATALGAVFASPHAQLRVYPGERDAWSDDHRAAVIRDLLAFADTPTPR